MYLINIHVKKFKQSESMKGYFLCYCKSNCQEFFYKNRLITRKNYVHMSKIMFVILVRPSLPSITVELLNFFEVRITVDAHSHELCSDEFNQTNNPDWF